MPRSRWQCLNRMRVVQATGASSILIKGSANLLSFHTTRSSPSRCGYLKLRHTLYLYNKARKTFLLLSSSSRFLYLILMRKIEFWAHMCFYSPENPQKTRIPALFPAYLIYSSPPTNQRPVTEPLRLPPAGSPASAALMTAGRLRGPRVRIPPGAGHPAAPARLLGRAKGGKGSGAGPGAVPSAAARPRRCPHSPTAGRACKPP